MEGGGVRHPGTRRESHRREAAARPDRRDRGPRSCPLPSRRRASRRSRFGTCRSHGERTLASSPGRFDLVGVRWHGSGTVRFSVRSTTGAWGPWLDAAAEEEDQPDARLAEAAATAGWRVGNPTWVGPSNGIRYRIERQGARPSGLLRPQPRAEDPAPRRRVGGRAADRAPQRLGRGRVDPAGRAGLRTGDPIRERAPHGGHERLLALSGGGDHARDPGLPRQVERLERHRLQLPRRPLRHGLRGSLRRHRPERGRRVRARLQHRLGRRGRDRDVRHVADPGRLPRRHSRSSSPGGSISPTSTRSPRSRSSRAGASAIPPASRSCSAPSRAIATRG